MEVIRVEDAGKTRGRSTVFRRRVSRARLDNHRSDEQSESHVIRNLTVVA